MKRGVWIAGLAAALLVGVVGIAAARGPMGMMGGGQGMMGGGRGMMGGGQGMMMGDGQGMMGGGRGMMMGGGHGMMGGGRGMMMGGGQGMMGGNMPCMTDGANYDPETAATHAEQMLTRHQSMVTNLETQLAAATNETVKTALAARIEQQKLVIGAQEVHVAVLKTKPATWKDAALATAKAEVEYWSKATSTDSVNKAWIALRLEQVKRHLALVEAQ